MKKDLISIIIFVLLPYSLLNGFPAKLDYDLAAHATQKGDWKKAKKLLNPLLVDHYTRADMLYDAGIISYKNNEFKKAFSYFSHAAENKQTPNTLREKAYFNTGNTLVALGDLKAAIDQYEKTLSINPANNFAQHNLDSVKKMIEQKQKEKEKKQKEEEQDNQQENKKKKEESANDQKKQSQSDDNQDNQLGKEKKQKESSQQMQPNEQKEPSLSDNPSPDNSSQNCDNKDKQSKQTERRTNGENREQKGRQHNRNNQGNGSNNENQGDSNKKTNNQLKNQPHNKKHNKIENHNFTSTQQGISTSSPDIYSQSKHQEQKKQDIIIKQPESSNKINENNAKSTNTKNKWITAILEKQEEKDKQANKKIMEAKIQKECTGKDGQNCW